MTNNTVTVVITIYNVSKYLPECIQSVITQTYTDLEIILVNDGSTDCSLDIAKSYREKDQRIKIIDQENSGLAAARNSGLSCSGGEYIIFIDGDDYLEHDMIEYLFNNLIKYKSDVSVCGRYRVYKNLIIPTSKGNDHIILTGQEAMSCYLDKKHITAGSTDKLFKRYLFNNIRFPDVKISEDVQVIGLIFNKCNSIIYNSAPKYYYRQRKSSISKNITTEMNGISAANVLHKQIKTMFPRLIHKSNLNILREHIFLLRNMLSKQEHDRTQIKKISEEIKKNWNISDIIHARDKALIIQYLSLRISVKLFNTIIQLRKHNIPESDMFD
jgi:glycosyltransferase involved in cell wall biosynthesis